MLNQTANHYSYKFRFNIDKLPATSRDRVSGKLIFFGFIFGLTFIALAAFEAFSYFYYGTEQVYTFDLPTRFSPEDILLQRYIFDGILLFLGILIVMLSVYAFFQRKIICYDGENISITHKSIFSEPKTETEPLYNYLGVLLRVEYYQLGLISRNRYIIELYHPEKKKRIPLYISTSNRNVRQAWEYYSAKLKMPALFMTDHGLISRHHSELNKTLRDMVGKWHLKSLYYEDNNVPSEIKCRKKDDRTIIKERQLFFDVYSLLAMLGIVILSSLAISAVINYELVLTYIGLGTFTAAIIFCLIVILLSVISLFSKDVLIINDDRILLGHNILFLRRDSEYVQKNQIAAVDIGHNPTTDRYYLSIISNDRSLIFGKNMPVEVLRWVRGFVIKEIAK